jgi:hypothetical protein
VTCVKILPLNSHSGLAEPEPSWGLYRTQDDSDPRVVQEPGNRFKATPWPDPNSKAKISIDNASFGSDRNPGGDIW